MLVSIQLKMLPVTARPYLVVLECYSPDLLVVLQLRQVLLQVLSSVDDKRLSGVMSATATSLFGASLYDRSTTKPG